MSRRPAASRPIRSAAPLAAALAALPAIAAASPAGVLPVFERELDPFPVRTAAGPVPRPAHGGWQDPRPQWIDVDADGDLDLFVAEETGKLRFYRNAGTPSSADWILETDEYAGVHRLGFARLADADADGDFDLLVEAEPFETVVGGNVVRRTGAFLYTNVGTPAAPDYRNLSPHPGGWLTDDSGAPIPFELTSPDFVDLDGDGDRDLFAGRVTGELALYRNVGAPSSPAFRLETQAYPGVLLVPGSCSGGAARPRPRHGYMTLSWFDLEADGLPDLFVGDEFNPNVYHLANEGGGASPALSCRTDFFFPGASGGPGFFPQRLTAAFGDADGDGDPDALLGSGVSATTGLHFFRNDGSASAPALVLVTDDLLPELDLGRGSAPVVADRDGDGAPDLFLGTGSGQSVTRWDNRGTASAPDFLGSTSGWAALPGSGWNVPEMGDVDGDGDADLLVGGNQGEVLWFRNDGGTGPGPQVVNDPDFGLPADRTFRSAIDAQAVPRLLDADADGDLDVVAGYYEVNGPVASLLLFRNDGSGTSHAFTAASADFARVGPLGQGLAPAFGDLDGNGSADAVVGRDDGTLAFLRNVGTPRHPAFVRGSDRLGGTDVGAGAVPALADLDADGDLDLVVGETGGGMNVFRNRTPPPAPPSAAALREPAPGAALNGRERVPFRWDPSAAPGGVTVAYELRLAEDPGAPPGEWVVIPAAGPEATVRLYSHGFRFATDVWWTVAAHAGGWSAAVPEWRHAVHATPDTLHQEDPGVPDERGDAPAVLAIRRVFPSPGAGPVRIAYETPGRGPVRVTVHDVAGRRVAELRESARLPGIHLAVWDGRTGDGLRAAAGLYVVRVEQDGRSAARRFVRLP
jgi:hypothetical protein